MASILSKLPLNAAVPDSQVAEAYFAAVSTALEDGKIIGDEAKVLANLAGEAGMGATQMRELNRRILDGLREAALADGVVTSQEMRELRRAAVALSEPNYFDDLAPTTVNYPPPRAKSRGRIWLHPDLVDDHSESVIAAGFTLGKNITKTLAAVVVSDALATDRYVERARELGVDVVVVRDLAHVLKVD